jgi:DNA processing protein
LDYRKYVIALREVAGVGPKTFQQLLLAFGSPENVYKKSIKEIAELPRIGLKKAEDILSSQDELQKIEDHILYLEERNVKISTILDEDYPDILKKIDSPPPLLYYKGEFPLEKDLFIALVGTHNATEEGKKEAVLLGKAVAERDGVVVSGLAKGIDKAAHMGALMGEGKTYAVLGNGLNNIYPRENLVLADEVTKNGALLTEFPLNTPVNVGQLMSRNRVVVGLSHAVIVVETEKTQGAVDAAKKASNLGKPLFVVKRGDEANLKELTSIGAVPIDGVKDLDLVLKYI